MRPRNVNDLTSGRNQACPQHTDGINRPEKPSRRGIVPEVISDCTAWDPRPVGRPELDPRFYDLSALERAAETIRFHAALAEYRLSPAGVLRSWLAVCLRLALALTVPAVLLLPPLILAAGGIAELAVLLNTAGRSLLEAVLAVTAAVFAVRLAVSAWRKWNEYTGRERPRRN